MNTVIRVILSSVVGHPYITFFIGMLALGDVVFIPAIYLSAHGTLNVWGIVSLALLAGMVSDGFWYVLGYVLPTQRINSWGFVRKRRHIQEKISKLVIIHAEVMIIVSKFTYGTRTLMQLVVGAQQIPLHVYLRANFLGHLLWFGSATIVAHLIQISAGALRETFMGTSIVFATFVIVVVLAQVALSLFLKRKYHLENKTETK